MHTRRLFGTHIRRLWTEIGYIVDDAYTQVIGPRQDIDNVYMLTVRDAYTQVADQGWTHW